MRSGAGQTGTGLGGSVTLEALDEHLTWTRRAPEVD